MVVFGLMIINKAGGLIYNKTVNPGLQALSSNDNLILAGTFHGIHAISRSLCPTEPLGSGGGGGGGSGLFSQTSNATTAGHTSTGGATSNVPAGFIPGATGAGEGGGGGGGSGTQRKAQATGILALESSHFRLTVHQTPTGVKFLLFTSPEQGNAEGVVKKCHELYSLYVMGNPFYSLEMPIRVEKFEREVGRWLARPV